MVAGSTPRPATTGPTGGSPAGSASGTATATPSARASATSGRPATGPTVAPAGQRLVTFVNSLTQTLWVAAGSRLQQPALSTTGWVLPAGQRLTITVPDKWNGRFWGRTGCTFDSGGKGHCETGDCAGRFQCRQYGAIPATLAEYNFNAWHNLDFYDVSLVDGSNVPMWINIVRGGSA